ncbi:acyltransferase family protein [Desulfosarcina ovata]|uniref:acyltransferase family protein n=1 Tax=Desulfosarcina ovata TaxID=83564 RepID=UPI0012D36E9D
MPSKNIESIYIAKGIAISLVVISHYAPNKEPYYWINIRDFLYTFHVPVFFMISGYLFRYRESLINNLDSYYNFIMKKAKRLLIPFFSISAFFLVVKYISGHIFNLQRPINLESVFKVVTNPTQSYKPILWYMFTLFMMFVIFPPLKKLFKSEIKLFLVSIVLLYIPWTNYFCINKLLLNFPVFILGYLIYSNFKLDTINLYKILIIFFASASILFISYYFYVSIKDLYYYERTTRLVLASSGSFFCLSISSIIYYLENSIIKTSLKTIGFYSMSIFLFHTLFESSIRLVYYQILQRDNSYFIPTAIFAVGSGIIFPLIIEKHYLRKFTITRQLVLGIR